MKTRSTLLAVLASLTGLVASANAQQVIYIVEEPIRHSACHVLIPNEIRSDYQPHLAVEYRNGYFAGRRDAAWGVTRNSPAAFRASGGRWESYFQEGYADGYDGRPIRH
jgi:hypothetical protein